MNNSKKQLVWLFIRLALGWQLIWAFFDKLFGLGFSTCRDKATGIIKHYCEEAWINGGSPTYGFLKYGTKGPFASFFQNMAESQILEFMFMFGLLGIGVGLWLGIFRKLTAISGFILMLLMYLAVMPPDHNPIVDEHIIYMGVFLLIFFSSRSFKLGIKDWIK